jgi:hypothetical protein
LPNFKANQPATFRLTRQGKTLTAAIRGEVVATKDLPEAVEFDTLSIGMAAPTAQYVSKLFNVKVVSLPP